MAQNAAVDVRGCKINIRRSGQGEPLLFLHGAQGSTATSPASTPGAAL